MNGPGPDITVPVDLSNPGQFFACCGLFELADRRSPQANVQAYFESRRFVITANEPTGPLGTLLEEFANIRCDQLDPEDRTASPLRLVAPFNLQLDWWWKPEKEKLDLGGANLKTWAGQQPGPLIFRLMKQAAGRAASTQSPLDYSEPVFDSKDGKAKGKTISPFYFDSRRQGTSLDFGFSPDEQNMSVEAYPAVESLALVGLQRFRPRMDEGSQPRSFVYSAWAEPLPVTVAAATVCGMVQVRSCGSYCFTKPSRGGEYVTMFSRATRERRENV
jgi:CRISPR-associated protein Csx14